MRTAPSFLTPNTDVPGSSCGHNDNCFHTNVSLLGGLGFILRRVGYPPFSPSPAYYGRCRSSVQETFQVSKLKFASFKQSRATPAPRSPTEITVRTVLETHLTSPFGDHNSSVNIGVFEKRNESSPGEDLERGK